MFKFSMYVKNIDDKTCIIYSYLVKDGKIRFEEISSILNIIRDTPYGYEFKMTKLKYPWIFALFGNPEFKIFMKTNKPLTWVFTCNKDEIEEIISFSIKENEKLENLFKFM